KNMQKHTSSITPKKGGKSTLSKAVLALAGTSLLAGGTVLPAAAASGVVESSYGSEYGYTAEVDSIYNYTDGSTWIGSVASADHTEGTDASDGKGYTWCIEWSKSANSGAAEPQAPSDSEEVTSEEAQIANIIVAKYGDDEN